MKWRFGHKYKWKEIKQRDNQTNLGLTDSRSCKEGCGIAFQKCKRFCESTCLSSTIPQKATIKKNIKPEDWNLMDLYTQVVEPKINNELERLKNEEEVVIRTRHDLPDIRRSKRDD